MKSANLSASNTRGRGKGRPFPKGISPNPAGRPRKTAQEKAETKRLRLESKRIAREVELRRLDVTLLSREHAVLAVKVLAQVAATSESDDTRVRAAGELLNRGFGKAVETSLTAIANVSHDPERQKIASDAMQRLRTMLAGTSAPPALQERVIEGETLVEPAERATALKSKPEIQLPQGDAKSSPIKAAHADG